MGDLKQFLNATTQQALKVQVGGYLDKETDEAQLIEQLKARYGLEQVYRFDIGKNCDGFSPLIRELLNYADVGELAVSTLDEYPDNHYRLLKKKLSEQYGVRPDWFLLGTGLDAIIDLVARAFLADGDRYLLPVPNFNLYEEYASRLGAVPVQVLLKEEDQYRWTAETTAALIDQLAAGPRLLWISNPVNPTGQLIPPEELLPLFDAAKKQGCCVVVDEAYGEYADQDDRVVSCARYAGEYPNLMVLRTFSKIYALPSIRVGYLICSSPDIRAGLQVYCPYFPVTWFSLYLAQTAFTDQDYLNDSRRINRIRRDTLQEGFRKMAGFSCLPSDTNTLMVRHAVLQGSRLGDAFASRGILTADLGSMTGLEGSGYHRITVRNETDNTYLLNVCRDLHKDCP